MRLQLQQLKHRRAYLFLITGSVSKSGHEKLISLIQDLNPRQMMCKVLIDTCPVVQTIFSLLVDMRPTSRIDRIGRCLGG